VDALVVSGIKPVRCHSGHSVRPRTARVYECLNLVLPRDGIPVAGGLFLLRRRARARAAHCQRQKRDGTDKIECGEYMFHGCSLFWLVVWSGFDFTTLVIRD